MLVDRYQRWADRRLGRAVAMRSIATSYDSAS
jgi:hypothetical protein